MKKHLLFASLLLAFQAFCQEQPPQKKSIENNFKINVVPLFDGIFEFQYERVLGRKSSIQVGFGTGRKEVTDRQEFQDLHLDTFGRTLNNPRNTNYSEKTFTVNIDYRYYFTEKAIPRGLYVSPSVQYISYKETFSAQEQESFGNGNGGFDFFSVFYERELKLYNIRAIVGYQFVIANIISLNPYFGPSFLIGDATDFFNREDKDEKGFGLNVGVFVGIGF